MADAVAAVRDELLAAVVRGADAEISFVVGVIEVEFAVELRQDSSVQAGVKAWVVSAGGEMGRGQSETHRVKVSLTPKGKDGGDLLVSARTGSHEVSDGAAGEVSGFIGR